MDYKYIELANLSIEELVEEAYKQRINLAGINISDNNITEVNKDKLIKILQHEYNLRQPLDFTKPVRKLVRFVYNLNELLQLKTKEQWKQLALLCKLPLKSEPVKIIKQLANYQLIYEKDLIYIYHPSFKDIFDITEKELKYELEKRHLNIIYHDKSNINRLDGIKKLLSFGCNNPYTLLSVDQLKIICKERGISVFMQNDNKSQIIHKLTKSDECDPQWGKMGGKLSLNVKLTGPGDEIEKMTTGVLLYHMAYNWLKVYKINVEDRILDNIRTIARISLRCGFLKERPPIRSLKGVDLGLQLSLKENKQEQYYEKILTNNGSNLTIMNIYEIISEGYYFNYEYLEKYFDAEQIIEMYRYPIKSNDPLYLNFMQHELLNQCLTLLNIDPKMQPFLKYQEIIFTLSRSYLPEFHVDNNRYYKLFNFNDYQLDILRRIYDIHIYDIKQKSELIAALSRFEESYLEKYISLLNQPIDNSQIIKIGNDIGMVIPSNMDAVAYFRNNIYSYRHIKYDHLPNDSKEIFNKEQLLNLSKNQLKSILRNYDDHQIFEMLGVKWQYNSRDTLISKSWNVLHGDNIFFILGNVSKRNCYNQHTAVMFDDITNENILLIGYGNLKEPCLAFGLTELESYFTPGQEGDFKFAIPIPGRKISEARFFSITKIKELKSLLLQYKDFCINNVDQINLIINKINSGLAASINANDEGVNLRKIYNKYSDNDKQQIKEALIKLFEVGMYARRWKGPGSPYPLLQSQTNEPISETELYLNFSLALSRFQTEISKLSKVIQERFYQMKTYRIINGNLQRLNNTTIQELLRKLGETYHNSDNNIGTEDAGCFRIGSVMLIGTAYYYLRLFCHYQIPDFDESKIDNIS